MNDEIFRDMANQMRPGDDVLAGLRQKLDAEQAPATLATRSRRRQRAGWFAAAACIVALASGLVLPGAIGHGKSVDLVDPPQTPGAAPAAPAALPGTAAEGYEQLLAAVQAAAGRDRQSASGESWDTGLSLPSAGAGPQRAPMPSAPGAASDASKAGAYQTNAQVAGIDEGDVVKTDGKAIYVSSGAEVIVLDAAGENTRELARIDTSKGQAADTSALKGAYAAQGPVADMMLSGNTLVVLVTDYVAETFDLPPNQLAAYVPMKAAITKALLYDVSDPSRPAYLTSLGQSGAFVTSRLLGDVLYVVTEYMVPEGVKPDDPETYVPLTTRDGTRAIVPAVDCFPLPYAQGPRYAVASSIDLGSRTRIDTEAVLGGSQTVYMSADNLFLGATDYEATLSNSQRKLAGVTDLRVAGAGVTHLARIKLDAGKLTLGAQATLPGQLLNQFSLDEYEGHLRLATTVSGESKGKNWVTRPALYVLDQKLKVVGSLPKLAKNESVQSVRFDGKVGYIVSFERRDPLFAIDLTDPAEPKVMSALKIPGFSTYLDVWADGRLLGLGVDTDDEGSTRGLKLSMFDTSNLFDVSEQAKLKVSFDESEALSNHKAVLVDRELGLIGFPAVSWNNKGTTSRYLVYGYDGTSFTLKEKLPLKAKEYEAATGVRGLRIEDYLYVASSTGVDVYTTESFNKVAQVGLG